MNTIEINNAKLSEQAIDFIGLMQEDNNSGFTEMEKTLTTMLIEIIQLRFGDERRDKYITHLADVLDMVNSLKA